MSKSTFVISLTPFTEAGALDEEGLRGHFGRLRDAGIGVYVAGSGSGEGYSLNADEQQRVLRIAGEELSGKVPVRGMGVEPRGAQEMIAFGRAVEQAGLDAMQVYSLDIGHGVSPTPRELELYLDEVLTSVEVPAVISTHHNVGYTVPLDVLDRMAARHEHLIGINCTVPGLPYVSKLVDLFAGRLELHVGGPSQALTILALGGNGYCCSEGNLAPKLCVSVTDLYEAGDYAAAHEAFARVIRLFAVNRYGSIRGIKMALQLLGLPGGYPRLPRLPVTGEERDEIARWLDELQISELG
ncbi:MAG TPA: dihydrodipicolinate synthase family protein [Gaiellaceae bacterium]|nr:dihydrodipicolinate synthase family protein [Gaiellaceae bacterium]